MRQRRQRRAGASSAGAFFSTLRTPLLAPAQAIARFGSTVASSAFTVWSNHSTTHVGRLGHLGLGHEDDRPRPRAGWRCACCRPRPCRRARRGRRGRAATRVRIFSALPRPVWISRPEWPPFSPFTVTSRPAPPAGASSHSQRPGAGAVAAARAADVQLALVLRVEVQQDRALEEARLQVVGARQPRLLVHREEELERPVLERSCPP